MERKVHLMSCASQLKIILMMFSLNRMGYPMSSSHCPLEFFTVK